MNLNRKHAKQIQSSSSTSKRTLDMQHRAHVSVLEERQSHVAALHTEAASLDTEIERLELDLRDVSLDRRDSIIDDIIRLKDRRIELRDRLRTAREGGPVDYFTKTADILYQYYDMFEAGASQAPAPHAPAPAPPAMSILRYFAPAPEAAAPAVAQQSETSSAEAASSKKNKVELMDKFLEHTEPNYVKHIDATVKCQCQHCGSERVSIIAHDGYVWCMECNTIEYIIIDHDKPSYKDPPKEVSYFAYKRINHLQEWLSQVQGKETTEIPEEIYDKILYEIKKQRISNMADLTQAKLRSILKKMKENKYYEHTAHILNRLNGMPAMHMPPELEERIRSMFKQIQTPFLKHAPSQRKNFLSYSYVLRKLVQLLDREDLMVNFKTLKSRQKTYAMDMTWKKICEELDWPFIQTI